MKNKTLFILITSIIAATFINCSRKINVVSDNSYLQKQSELLEMNYGVQPTEQLTASNAPTNEMLLIENKHLFKQTNTETKTLAKERFNTEINVEKKTNFRNSIKTKIEKTVKQSHAKSYQRITDRTRTGIIIGAIGLIFLITAGFFGGASGIIYVTGAILFVIGVIVILLEIL